jgi:VanZ family protein
MILRNTRLWRVLLVLCLIAVTTLSLIPDIGPEVPHTGWDKSNHALAFVVLTLLASLAFPGHPAGVVLGLIAYGGLIEALQSLTPHRLAEWADWLADGIGIVIGLALFQLVRWLWRQLRGLSP